jgi:calcium-dependent protein kinase
VWALGVLMFILVFGTLPFNRERRNHSIIFQQIHPEPCFPAATDPPSAPPAARELLLAMLELDAESRVTSAQMMKHPYLKKKGKAKLRTRVSSFFHHTKQ